MYTEQQIINADDGFREGGIEIFNTSVELCFIEGGEEVWVGIDLDVRVEHSGVIVDRDDSVGYFSAYLDGFEVWGVGEILDGVDLTDLVNINILHDEVVERELEYQQEAIRDGRNY